MSSADNSYFKYIVLLRKANLLFYWKNFNTMVITKFNLKNYKYRESHNGIYTCLYNKNLINKVCVRTMISSKSLYAIRALFNTAIMLSNTEMVDKVSRQNTAPFVKSAVDLALDHDKGVLQHKAAILKHATTQRFPADEFYEPFRNITKNTKVHWEPNTNIDLRTVNELGVFHEYFNTFGKDIEWALATLDKRSSNFPHQKQSNVDFWVYFDRVIGLHSTGKGIFQDEKSGMDIFKHSTSGSIGLLSYDEHGNNIQTMNELITPQVLANKNLRKIHMLAEAARVDKLSTEKLDKVFSECQGICDEMKTETFSGVVELHTQLQNVLWEQLQCSLDFKRSISFVFIKQLVTSPASLKEETFSRVFRANIQEDRLYNLDRKQDFNTLYKAMILAGKEIDPQFVKKLGHLHHNGITLNNDLLHILAELVKHGL